MEHGIERPKQFNKTMMSISIKVLKSPSTANKSNDIFSFRKFDFNEMRLKLYYQFDSFIRDG